MKKTAIWCFYHPQTQRLVKALDLVEAKAFGLPLTPDQKSEWFAWRTGWSAWHGLSEVQELRRIQDMEEDSIRYPMLPGDEADAVTVPGLALVDGPDLNIEDQGDEFIPRAHPRHKKVFRIEMEWQDQKFECVSQDISNGGVLLGKSIPNEWAGYITVRVIDEKSGAFFVRSGSIVENQAPEKRFRVEFVALATSSEQDEFETWLEAA